MNPKGILECVLFYWTLSKCQPYRRDSERMGNWQIEQKDKYVLCWRIHQWAWLAAFGERTVSWLELCWGVEALVIVTPRNFVTDASVTDLKWRSWATDDGGWRLCWDFWCRRAPGTWRRRQEGAVELASKTGFFFTKKTRQGTTSRPLSLSYKLTSLSSFIMDL